MSFGKVLCASDLSSAADVALRLADREARRHGAELLVLHVLPNALAGAPMFPHLVERTMVERERLASQVIEDLLDRLRRLVGRSAEEVTLLVEEGAPHVAIVKKAEEVGAGLIVVGGAGATGLRRVFLGSVADKVVRYAHTSVLVARPPERETNRILVAVDFSPPSEKALAFAAEEARLAESSLIVVHSLELVGGELAVGEPAAMPPTAFRVLPLEEVKASVRQRLQEALTRTGIAGEVVVTVGPAGRALVRLAEDAGADLLVLGTAGRTGIERIILGSVAEAVVRDAHCPVLVVRSPAGAQRAPSEGLGA